MSMSEKSTPTPYRSTRKTTSAANPAEDAAEAGYNTEANETGKDPIPTKTPDSADIPDAGKKK